MANLWEIKNEYLEALNNIEVNEDGEIIGIEVLEAATGTLEEKIEACIMWIKREEALIQGIADEEKALKERKSSHEKRLFSLKENVAATLKETGLITEKQKKYETAKFALSTKPSTSVEVDEKVIAQTWKNPKTTTTWSADKARIKEALINGELIEGAKLVKKANLQIK